MASAVSGRREGGNEGAQEGGSDESEPGEVSQKQKEDRKAFSRAITQPDLPFQKNFWARE